MQWKKGFQTAIVFVVGVTPIWGASDSTEGRLSSLEKTRASMHIVKPQLDYKNAFFLSGDYLYWRASEYALEYAVSVTEINPGSFSESVDSLPFKATSGFRLGAGYRMPHDKWELNVHWTWLLPKAHGSSPSSITPSTLVYSVDNGNYLPSNTSLITSSWKVHLNILDGELARYFKATKWLAFKPHFGIRGLWIYQKSTVSNFGGTQNPGGVILIMSQTQFKNQFAGAGLVCGLNTEWEMWRHWSFFGDVAGSLIYGTFHNLTKLSLLFAATPNDLSMTYFKAISNQIVPTAAIAFGLRYDQSFLCDKMALRLQIGWELNDFFAQNKRPKSLTGEVNPFAIVWNNGDLTTQGLVASARFDF